MDGTVRREKIMEILYTSTDPISGTELAKRLNVSRQVIVQDIALLRSVNKNILATARGYLLYKQENLKINRVFTLKHNTEDIEDELCTIVDHGGSVLDVIVSHKIYGEIKVDLVIKNRQDVYAFVTKVKERKTVPLKDLAGGIHLHTVEAESKEILDKIEADLRQKGYLVDVSE